MKIRKPNTRWRVTVIVLAAAQMAVFLAASQFLPVVTHIALFLVGVWCASGWVFDTFCPRLERLLTPEDE